MSRGEKRAMGVVLGVAMMGLSLLAVEVMRPARQIPPEDRPGAGLLVHDEVTMVWLPDEWLALAAAEPRGGIVHSTASLRSALEGPGQGDLWYALFVEGRQVNGETAPRILLRTPARQPENLEEFREVLAAAGGWVRRVSALDFTNAGIRSIPAEFQGLGPVEALAALSSVESAVPGDRRVDARRSPAPDDAMPHPAPAWVPQAAWMSAPLE